MRGNEQGEISMLALSQKHMPTDLTFGTAAEPSSCTKLEKLEGQKRNLSTELEEHGIKSHFQENKSDSGKVLEISSGSEKWSGMMLTDNHEAQKRSFSTILVEEHGRRPLSSEEKSFSGEALRIISGSPDDRGPSVREEPRAQQVRLLRADRATPADLANFLVKSSSAGKAIDKEEGSLCITASSPDIHWLKFFNTLVRWILFFFKRPMDWFRFVLELFLNGGGLRGFVLSLLTGRNVVRGNSPETYLSVEGHVDTRLGLQKLPANFTSEIEKMGARPLQMDDQALMDLCVMASKVAYESADVVQNTVNKQWKMHLVKFYDFWNEYRKERSTQAFVMANKHVDADVILICFRGARTFDANDLGMAFDYSWYHVPGMGKIHVGYLEALGLGTRDQMSTIQSSLEEADGILEKEQEAAYFALRNMLRSLLVEHPKAKFVVTGHGTGGALAALLPAIFLFNEERELINRWSGVYTFGQPRIGDGRLEQFMQAHSDKYSRVVYGNDVMPSLPYDDGMFYKHFGQRLHYNSRYLEKMEAEPSTDFIGIRSIMLKFLNSLRELVRGVSMQYVYGPEYKETQLLLYSRVLALVEPGVSAHSLTNYINCVRLGRRVRKTC